MTNVLVSLSDMKAHLRFPNPSQPNPMDSALTGFIAAAEECIRFECDEVLPRAYSERHDGGSRKIFTYNRPIVSIQNIQEGWGWINYDLDFQDANTPPSETTMFGYSLDNKEAGEISRRTVASVPIPFIPGENNIFIQYVAGYSPIPANITLAAKMLVGHWFRNEALRASAVAGANLQYDSVSGSVYTRDTESGVQNINIGVPNAILELIKAHRRTPIIA